MNKILKIVGTVFLLFSVGCAQIQEREGRAEVTKVSIDGYQGNLIGVDKYDTFSKFGYKVSEENLKLLSDLGVVCKDDDNQLAKIYEKVGSYAYCENDAMAQERVIVLKTKYPPEGKYFATMSKYFNAWSLKTKLFKSEGNLTCVSSRLTIVAGTDLTDCTFSYKDKQYYITFLIFMSKMDSANILILGNIQDSSSEAKEKTKELLGKLAR